MSSSFYVNTSEHEHNLVHVYNQVNQISLEMYNPEKYQTYKLHIKLETHHVISSDYYKIHKFYRASSKNIHGEDILTLYNINILIC